MILVDSMSSVSSVVSVALAVSVAPFSVVSSGLSEVESSLEAELLED